MPVWGFNLVVAGSAEVQTGAARGTEPAAGERNAGRPKVNV